MSGWTFAWSDPDEVERRDRASWRPFGARAAALLGLAFAVWLFLFASGILPTPG